MPPKPRASPPVDADPPTLVSAGYEGRTAEGLVAALRDAGVQLVVDVRELPLSRKRGLSKTPLREALAKHGIAYHHLRALGAPRGPRHELRRTGSWPPFSVAYQHHLDEQQEAIEELLDLARARRTALLCFEADTGRCHRGILLRRVGARVEELPAGPDDEPSSRGPDQGRGGRASRDRAA